MKKEFKQDLLRWRAVLTPSLVFKFGSPDIMFDPQKSVIKKKFKNILNQFCPRYFSILSEYQAHIEEVRVEGHTSKEWIGAGEREAYFNNMQLSQDRTRAVLRYCMGRIGGGTSYNWVKSKATANGLSSSRPNPKCRANTIRCNTMHRRVEFRIQLDETQLIKKVEDLLKK